MRFLVDECAVIKMQVLRQLLASYADRLPDRFATVSRILS